MPAVRDTHGGAAVKLLQLQMIKMKASKSHGVLNQSEYTKHR